METQAIQGKSERRKGGRTGNVSGEEGLRALRLAYDVLKEIETA
jgi:hypothetical protein